MQSNNDQARSASNPSPTPSPFATPLSAALLYHRLGWSPIPIAPREKFALVSWRPYQDRQPTPDEIQSWFTRWPDANVALVTGRTSGMAVLDADSPEAEELLKDLPATLTSVTGRGRHRFYRCPGAPTPSRSPLPKVDLKADGGYVLVCPSIHPSGVQYRWEGWNGTNTHAILAPLPDLPLRLVRRPRGQDSTSAAAEIREGARNNELTRIAGFLRHQGAELEAIQAALLLENQARCKPPLGEGEVVAIATSVSKYPPGVSGRGKGSGRDPFNPIPLRDLLNDQSLEGEADWLLKGFLARGCLTLISGDPKAGKTTFCIHLAHAIATGTPFLGREANASPVLWVDLEQHPRLTRTQFQRLRFPDVPALDVYNGIGKDWSRDDLARYIEERRIGLVIVDSLSRYWDVKDENDATHVTRATDQLLALARSSNAAFLLIHHTRKNPEGHPASNARGSSALGAAVDICLIYKRHEQDTRLIESVSRYEATPDDLVIDRRDNAFVVCGGKDDHQRGLLHERLLGALRDDFLPVSEIADATEIPGGTVRPYLDDLLKEGLVERRGAGVKNDPYLWGRNRLKAAKTPEKNSADTPNPMPSEGDFSTRNPGGVGS